MTNPESGNLYTCERILMPAGGNDVLKQHQDMVRIFSDQSNSTLSRFFEIPICHVVEGGAIGSEDRFWNPKDFVFDFYGKVSHDPRGIEHLARQDVELDLIDERLRHLPKNVASELVSDLQDGPYVVD
jgi:hypothetical protein